MRHENPYRFGLTTTADDPEPAEGVKNGVLFSFSLRRLSWAATGILGVVLLFAASVHGDTLLIFFGIVLCGLFIAGIWNGWGVVIPFTVISIAASVYFNTVTVSTQQGAPLPTVFGGLAAGLLAGVAAETFASRHQTEPPRVSESESGD